MCRTDRLQAVSTVCLQYIFIHRALVLVVYQTAQECSDLKNPLYTHYLRTVKQGRTDGKTMYSKQCIKGVRHISRTGFSPYAVHKICIRVAVLSTNTKYFFIEKKIVCHAKIDGEQRTVYSNTFVSFSPTIFYLAKK